jgi:hypothetical protein
MLNTMQMMEYFVKTGFGIADTPTFGAQTMTVMNLGQGSGAAPIGMRNIITLTDNAYKRLGHGMYNRSAINQRLFLLLLPSSMWMTLTSTAYRMKSSSPMYKRV